MHPSKSFLFMLVEASVLTRRRRIGWIRGSISNSKTAVAAACRGNAIKETGEAKANRDAFYNTPRTQLEPIGRINGLT
jgi:hypothetical protein